MSAQPRDSDSAADDKRPPRPRISPRFDVRRSKILLTRLVAPSALSATQRAHGRRGGVAARNGNAWNAGSMVGLPGNARVERARRQAHRPPGPVRSALRGGGVNTFFFHSAEGAASVVAPGRRRAGDPPVRHLGLSYGLVTPHSMAQAHVSNPRAAGALRAWYAAAVRNGVVAPRPEGKPLRLGAKRLVLKPVDPAPGHARSTLRGIGVPAVVQGEWARSLGLSPRLIVVGDVHGCIDELRTLLRLADYTPGDQVVLLGDLVAKGPDSVGVVQLAREIGARSVRGNHDHEVIRCFEAASRGAPDAVVSLEHARIARALGPEEHAWLMDSPWFIESGDMRHLFVHAGFIPGVKLTQQNPRLMMNMRSVLDDGTVTAKNVPRCAWAKLWRGPQTVVFGHDAFRGLQQYDFAKGIDTGCVYGGRLTALLLPENRFISVPAKRSYVSSKRYRARVSARRAAMQYKDVALEEIQELRLRGDRMP